MDRLLTIDDVARMLGVPKQTVYEWRSRGTGPKGRRVGRYVRFRREDVESWIDAQPERGGKLPARA